MADPEVDHEFVEDAQGRTDIFWSPFFDLRLDHDQSAEEYVDHILYQLTLSIEEHIRPGRWQIIGHPPTSPTLANSPTTNIRGFHLLLVASLGSQICARSIASPVISPNSLKMQMIHERRDQISDKANKRKKPRASTGNNQPTEEISHGTTQEKPQASTGKATGQPGKATGQPRKATGQHRERTDNTGKARGGEQPSGEEERKGSAIRKSERKKPRASTGNNQPTEEISHGTAQEKPRASTGKAMGQPGKATGQPGKATGSQEKPRASTGNERTTREKPGEANSHQGKRKEKILGFILSELGATKIFPSAGKTKANIKLCSLGNKLMLIAWIITENKERTDILASPFFDVHFGIDETVEDYVDRIPYQLTLSIEEHIPPGCWYLVSCPSSSPNPATSPATTTLRTACLLMASLSVLATFFR
ncbi:hypothetical protein M5K25_005811 [Dendrobium thyrsiflorum]|uniref:Uncharacterized protein n=1 Tax=Dendrobium thyrsiflorum TaxID=117978 RepID=A0ABD0VJP4_DENTH